MNKYKLFLRDPKSGRLGVGGEYAYDGEGLLELHWYGEVSYHHVSPGTAVLVQLGDETRDVRRLMPPKRLEDKVMWLCGISKAVRCRTLAEYDEAASCESGPVEHIGGPHWQVARSLGANGGMRIVAAWVDMRISCGEARRMMTQVGCIAPEWFANRLLRRW